MQPSSFVRPVASFQLWERRCHKLSVSFPVQDGSFNKRFPEKALTQQNTWWEMIIHPLTKKNEHEIKLTLNHNSQQPTDPFTTITANNSKQQQRHRAVETGLIDSDNLCLFGLSSGFWRGLTVHVTADETLHYQTLFWKWMLLLWCGFAYKFYLGALNS